MTVENDARKRIRILSLDPEFRGHDCERKTILNADFEWILAAEASRRGYAYVVLGAKGAVDSTDFPAIRRGTFDDTEPDWTFPHDWLRLWQTSRCFSDRVLRDLDGLQSQSTELFEDRILIYRGGAPHIAAAIQLGLALRGRTPIILNLFELHFVYGRHGVSKAPGLANFLQATSKLRKAANVNLCVDSQRLAKCVLTDTEECLTVLPFFSGLSDGVHEGNRPQSAQGKIRIFYSTYNVSSASGFDLVVGLAQALAGRNVEIIMRGPAEGAHEVHLLPKDAGEWGIKAFSPSDDYAEHVSLMRDADLVLVPHRRWPSESCPVDVVADAITLLKPMVGTSNCWIGDQINALGAGETFEDGDLGGLVRAVNAVLANLSTYRDAMRETGPRWSQENSPCEFLQAVKGCDGPKNMRPNPARAGTAASTREPISWLERDSSLWKLSVVLHLWAPFLDRIVPGVVRWAKRVRAVAGRKATGRLSLNFDVDVPGGKDARFDEIPTIYWRCRGVTKVELRLDSPDGMSICQGGEAGSVWGTYWIEDGRPIFLQDVSEGRPLCARHTLDRIAYRSVRPLKGTRRLQEQMLLAMLPMFKLTNWLIKGSRGRLFLTPQTVEWGRKLSNLRIRWVLRRYEPFEIRVNGAHGRLLEEGSGSGSCTAGEWVRARAGTSFHMLGASQKNRDSEPRILDMATLWGDRRAYPITSLERAFAAAKKTLDLRVLSRRAVCPEAWTRRHLPGIPLLQAGMRFLGLGGRLKVEAERQTEEAASTVRAKVSWNVHWCVRAQVRVHAPDGPIFAERRGSGSQETDRWVKDGTSFFLLGQSIPWIPTVCRILDAKVVSLQASPRSAQIAESSSANVEFAEHQRPHIRPPGAETRYMRRAGKARPEDVVGPEDWGIIPAPGVGEMFLVAAYSKTFLDRYGGNKLIVFAPPHVLDVCRLFPHAPLVSRNSGDYDLSAWRPPHCHTKARSGRVLRWDYNGAFPVYGGVTRYSGMSVPHSFMFLNEVGLDLASPFLEPIVSPGIQDAARNGFTDHGLIPGRTVLMAPGSKSAPQVSVDVWAEIAQRLGERGFTIATNAPPGENPVPGTIPLNKSLSELFAIAQLADLVIASRSGICDMLAFAGTRLHILRPDRVLSLFPGTVLQQSLAEAGLRDTATYHTMQLDETSHDYSNRLLSHADFQ
jgi:hypothetical protein